MGPDTRLEEYSRAPQEELTSFDAGFLNETHSEIVLRAEWQAELLVSLKGNQKGMGTV